MKFINLYMVSNATQEFVFSVVDAQQEFNIKLITMSVIFLYVMWLNYKFKDEDINSWGSLITKLMAKLLYYPTLLFTPLYLLLLVREFSFIQMWTWLLISYSVVFFVVFCVGLIYGFEYIMKMMGFDFSFRAFKEERFHREDNESQW